MKTHLICLFAAALLLAACSSKDWMDTSLSPEKRAGILLKQMTLEEKIGQMCQYVGPCYVEPGKGSASKNIDADGVSSSFPEMSRKIREGKIGSFLHVLTNEEAVALQKIARQSRLKIPLLIGVDAVHGNGLIAGCTVYPTSLGMACSFHPEQMERIGKETAEEMRHTGIYWTFTPNLDVSRDARWGRCGETFGEDPLLVSEMGKHFIWGLQGRNGYGKDGVLACAKHFAAGGSPNGGLNAAPMETSEQTLREIYFYPFQVAIKEAKVGSIMPAHNEINGIPCHGNRWLLQDVLRAEFGFDGFIVSDWMDIDRLHAMHQWAPDSAEAFVRSVEAGIDIHMQGDGYFEALLAAVKSGRLSERDIDRAVLRILKAKFALGLFECPIPPQTEKAGIPNREAHRRTALQAARESIVLLKNDGILPLQSPKRIFVCGPNADSQTILGDWAVPQNGEDVITAYEGLRDFFTASAVDTACFGGHFEFMDEKNMDAACRKAAAADVCILVLGENSERYSAFVRTCGENCDRDNLELPGRQQELLERCCATGKPVVLVLLNGRPLSLAWAAEHVNAIVEAWEPGMMGGQAIAEVLGGKVNPSGRLAMSIPRNVGQVPCFYNHKASQYSRQFACGPTGVLYPFGFGLSYSDFRFGNAEIFPGKIRKGESACVSVEVSNRSEREGTAVVQLYVRDDYASMTRPVKELKAFRRVPLKAGESRKVKFSLTPEMLQCWGADGKWSTEPGTFTICIGSSSADTALHELKLELTQ